MTRDQNQAATILAALITIYLAFRFPNTFFIGALVYTAITAFRILAYISPNLARFVIGFIRGVL